VFCPERLRHFEISVWQGIMIPCDPGIEHLSGSKCCRQWDGVCMAVLTGWFWHNEWFNAD